MDMEDRLYKHTNWFVVWRVFKWTLGRPLAGIGLMLCVYALVGLAIVSGARIDPGPGWYVSHPWSDYAIIYSFFYVSGLIVEYMIIPYYYELKVSL